MATPSQTPAGWYPDPAGQHQSRYWDGSGWAATVSDGLVTATGPLGAPAPPVPAAGEAPAAGPGPLAATGPGPAGGRRGRRRWAVLAIALVAALGVAAALVIWAPWTSPPVLRPAGLRAGQPTTSSAAFHWSRPATGPLPDRYLILRDGKVIAAVRGTVTSYQDQGLAPATTYGYRVAAVRGGKRSPLSAVVSVTTATPPLSAARVQGPWTVTIKVIRGGATLSGKGPKMWTESWLATPACAAGPCPVRLAARMNGHAFKATLARTGAVYTGKTTANVFPCGTGSASFPIRSTLTIRLKITTAQTQDRAWIAAIWAGTITVVSPYTASGSYYCAGGTVTTTVSGTY